MDSIPDNHEQDVKLQIEENEMKGVRSDRWRGFQRPRSNNSVNAAITYGLSDRMEPFLRHDPFAQGYPDPSSLPRLHSATDKLSISTIHAIGTTAITGGTIVAKARAYKLVLS